MKNTNLFKCQNNCVPTWKCRITLNANKGQKRGCVKSSEVAQTKRLPNIKEQLCPTRGSHADAANWYVLCGAVSFSLLCMHNAVTTCLCVSNL